jgi:hypothetical protein
MLGVYLSCSIVAMILLIWFRSDAFLEYCRAFGLKRFYEHYDSVRENEDARLTYHEYLLKYHNNFFIRLITCPVCSSVWIDGGVALMTMKLWTLPVAMVGGLILYLIIDRLLDWGYGNTKCYTIRFVRRKQWTINPRPQIPPDRNLYGRLPTTLRLPSKSR